MRKIITIGESILNIIFQDDKPIASFPGGRIINIAASTASAGIPTFAVSECATDMIGNIIVDYLNNHAANTKSIDRFTDGNTSVSMIFPDKTDEKQIVYGKHPANRFDVIWPRIDEDDILVFGSFYSIDPELRVRLFELVTHAVERKAIIIYLPGFMRNANFRITKVMTAILENLESANIVIARNTDATNIFDSSNAKEVFKNRIAFYCPNYIQIDNDYNISLFSPTTSLTHNNSTDKIVNPLSWHSGFCAGLIYGIVINNIKQKEINSIDPQTWEKILKCAKNFAIDSHLSGTNCISKEFANHCKIELDKSTLDNQEY